MVKGKVRESTFPKVKALHAGRDRKWVLRRWWRSLGEYLCRSGPIWRRRRCRICEGASRSSGGDVGFVKGRLDLATSTTDLWRIVHTWWCRFIWGWCLKMTVAAWASSGRRWVARSHGGGFFVVVVVQRGAVRFHAAALILCRNDDVLHVQKHPPLREDWRRRIRSEPKSASRGGTENA